MPQTFNRVKTINFSSKEEDVELVTKIKKGDKNAFDGIVKKYRLHIYNKISQQVGFDKQYTEDIVQDIFVKIYTNIDKFDPTHYSFSAWITSMVRNQLVDQIRRDKFRPTYRNSLRILPGLSSDLRESLELDTCGVSIDDLNLSCESTIEQEIDSSIRTFSIKTFIKNKLNETEQKVIKMFYMEQLKYNEITEILGVDMTTVKVNLHRAKKKLQREFGQTAFAA